MMIFSISTVIVSIFLASMSHPISIMIAILLQTLIVCLNLWILTKTSWFSYILFLIFIGGLMVLFIYIVSLASNEKFEPKIEDSIYTYVISSTIVCLMIFLLFFQSANPLSMLSLMEMTHSIFSQKMMWPTMMIMVYLLFTLIVAVKISSKFEGSLRSII